jgi:uncharacterized protein with beta-barrel porin domain
LLRKPWLVVGGWWLVVVTETVRNYKELRVWQGAMDLVESVYRLSAGFPPEENYGWRSQIRRAAVSIPSNIAEGQSRASAKEFLNHLAVDQVTAAASAIQKLGKQIHALRTALETRK